MHRDINNFDLKVEQAWINACFLENETNFEPKVETEFDILQGSGWFIRIQREKFYKIDLMVNRIWPIISPYPQ
jgi:hypothetical protein